MSRTYLPVTGTLENRHESVDNRCYNWLIFINKKWRELFKFDKGRRPKKKSKKRNIGPKGR